MLKENVAGNNLGRSKQIRIVHLKLALRNS